MRNFQFPGRSPTRSTRAMVSTSHPLATESALAILHQGGNAMDAAIAASAVLSVVEPQATSIGGDCFMLFVPAGETKPIAYNGSGRSPAAASVEWYQQQGFSQMPATGPHAVTIPGAIEAWYRLNQDHGRLPFADLLADAITYAEQGYCVTDRVAFDWQQNQATLHTDPIAQRIMLNNNQPYQAGEIHYQPELASTLKHLAQYGKDGFYKGKIAEDMVNHLTALGGLHSLDDFSQHEGSYVEPLSLDYRGYTVYEVPPNNSGLTALIMFNLLKGYDLSAFEANSADRLHLEIEIARQAYYLRDQLIGDPDFTDIPIDTLLSNTFAEQIRQTLDINKASTQLPKPIMQHSDTVYLSVVDSERNTVSCINSVFHAFGSGVMSPSGVLFQGRGASFQVDASHPNSIAPRKRPMHTIMPAMLMKNGQTIAPFGVMGGDYQPMGQQHVLSGVIDFALDPQAAIDAPRVFYRNNQVIAEQGISSDVMEALRHKGHDVVISEEAIGGGQMIWIDWQNNTLTAGSDPRKDGCALGY